MKANKLEFHLSDYCNNYVENPEGKNETIYNYCVDYLKGNYTARTKEVLIRYFESKIKS